MALQTLRTISRNKPFDFKYADGEEIVVYSSDGDGRPQNGARNCDNSVRTADREGPNP
jgi:hypothetical protein